MRAARGQDTLADAAQNDAAAGRTPDNQTDASQAGPKDLARLLDAALMPAGLKATLGACVVEVPSGRIIYESNADEPLAPASNMKLITTAVALEQLGARHKLRTRLLRNGQTLALIGGADPAFADPNIAERLGIDRTADYAAWVEALKACGTAGQIRNLLFDDSILDSQWRHPNWSQREYQHWYCAPVGGLVLNDSCIDVAVEAADGKTIPMLLPPCSLFEVINKSTVGKGDAIVVARPQDKWQLIVSGRCSGRTGPSSVTVPDPGTFAASVL
jgi:D-alanyl-D-alanine carboxypeptidase/D-alanyl-D-alanine-endopeptidase (penicillin-binding protein 4)